MSCDLHVFVDACMCVIPERAGPVKSVVGRGVRFRARSGRVWTRLTGVGVQAERLQRSEDVRSGRRRGWRDTDRSRGTAAIAVCGCRVPSSCVPKIRGWAEGSAAGHPFPTFCLGLVRASRRVRSPRGAGCGCHSFALGGSRRLAARHPATTRLLIENCGTDRCVGIGRRGRLRARLASTGRRCWSRHGPVWMSARSITTAW